VMNDYNQLLALLDRVFGFTNIKVGSTFKKVQQFYDQQSNETVIMLEYRVRTKGIGVAKDSVSDRQKQNLLRQVNGMAQADDQQNQAK